MKKYVAGLDAGHARTSMSEYVNGELHSYTFQNDKYCFSEVAYDPHHQMFYIGSKAREHMLDKDIQYFKNFKMLLCEHDQQVLEDNGYIDFTPKEIYSEFLKQYIQDYLQQKKISMIDKLYVGVPEVCYEMGSQIDYRQEIKDILDGIYIRGKKAIKEVYLNSEPVDAGAYYVVEHDHKYHEHFAGHVLVIDYGAGTLDITLLKVVNNRNKEISDIIVIKRMGLGKNTQHHIGQGANAFYEAILDIALKKQNIQYTKDQQYYHIYQILEKEVIHQQQNIEDIYDDALCGMNSKQAFQSLENIQDILTKIEYKNHTLEITYGMLAKAYFEVIYNEFDHLLDDVITYMEKQHIPYLASIKESIKIVVTGGFSNFALVKLQIHQKFKRIGHDMRFASVPDASNAVANGLAYFASDLIRFKKTAPFSIGIKNYRTNAIYYAIEENEPYEIDVPIFIQKKSKTGQYIDAKFQGHYIPSLFFKKEILGLKEQECFAPSEDLSEKLQLNFQRDVVYAFGFSLDRNEIISLYKKGYRYEHSKKGTQYKEIDTEKVELTDLYSFFGGLIEVDE